jgi:hypothetical protein
MDECGHDNALKAVDELKNSQWVQASDTLRQCTGRVDINIGRRPRREAFLETVADQTSADSNGLQLEINYSAAGQLTGYTIKWVQLHLGNPKIEIMPLL